MPRLRVIFLTIILSVLSISGQGADRSFIPNSTIMRLNFYSGSVVSDSDTLYLNRSILQRGIDYSINYLEAKISFLNPIVRPGDTIDIIFTPLPNWLRNQYGKFAASTSPRSIPTNETIGVSGSEIFPPQSSGFSIAGAKSFSVFSETSGASQFNQSLELTISGELSPGLSVTGAISDREYGAPYGTINSTINELDKVYMRIQSTQFESEIGNLEIYQESDFGRSASKQVSGIQAFYHTDRFTALATVARPRGQFETARFQGTDFNQGPYRIATSGQITSIVPGSEKVWLDGQLLEQGADKDYTIDYAAANITFSPRHSVDSRSRIEIDYEPLNENFQKEYYRFKTGISNADSSVSAIFWYQHEGDNKDQLVLGELSTTDKNILSIIGDNVDSGYRDGAVTDTAGTYSERFDSTGFRYFEYVGKGMGEYSVKFSSVGSNMGEYRYLGNEMYEYVGAGRGNYIARIPIPVPSKDDYFDTEVKLRPNKNSHIDLIARQSIEDKNLFSALNDNDNYGGQYILKTLYGERPKIYSQKSGISISVNRIDKNFKSFNRRNSPDFTRKYLIPDNFIATEDETEILGSMALVPPSVYSAFLSGSLLDYRNKFGSKQGEISLYPDSEISLLPIVTYSRLSSRLDSLGANYYGRGTLFRAAWNHSLNNIADFTADISRQKRTNRYRIVKRGTIEKSYDLSIRRRSMELRFEKYDEDTLTGEWRSHLKRDRVTLAYEGKLLGIRSNLFLSAQKFRQEQINENQTMARIKLSHTPTRSNLSISSSYGLSDENRYERGIRYIEVEPGFGQFIFDDSQYIPDPNGNFIEAEEILSNQESVNKGERQFNFLYNPKDYYIRLNSSITEELPSGSGYGLLWVLPFYSDGGKEYFFRKLYYSGDVKILKNAGFYILNFSGSYNLENRQIGNQINRKYEKILKAEIHESSGAWHFLQGGSYFEYRRDSYYSSPGNIDGFTVSADLIRHYINGQINGSLSFRTAKDDNGSESRQYMLEVKPTIGSHGSGQTDVSILGYLQELTSNAYYSYRLTNNLSGKRGLVWSIRSEYRVGKDLKLVASFGGRHADDRKPRITGRGEFIANF